MPTGTSVEFYLRSAETEEELLNRIWNDIGTTGESEILPPFTVSGAGIIEFSQESVSTNAQNVTVKRFIQFKMVLKSRVSGITPMIDDVTITYSKLNSVNFYTTTFNLSSNIVRALLTYNGDIPVDASGGIS